MLELMSNPWYIVTLLGSPELWSIFAALLFGAYIGFRTSSIGVRRGERASDLLFVLVPTLLLTFVVVVLLKGYLAVPRACLPCMTELVGCNPYCPLDASMPSGHAATAFAGFTVVWLFRDRMKQWLLIYIFPVLVAVSRIMLGVHTWADVLAGAFLGMGISLLVWEIDKRV